MIKFERITPNEDGLAQEKLHETIPQEDKYFKTSLIYVELTKIESIEYCKDFKGSACCNINTYSGDRFTLVINMDKLSDMVVEAKSSIIFKGYNN